MMQLQLGLCIVELRIVFFVSVNLSAIANKVLLFGIVIIWE
jgi:hypothetical protein